MMLMAKVKAAALGLVAVGVAGTVTVTAVQTQTGSEGAGTNAPILRQKGIPISLKDADGAHYVAVPVERLEERPRQMWSPGAGMTFFYSRLLRLTREEQSGLQTLLEEAWLASDGLADAFDVTTEGDSVVATLRMPGGLETIREVQDRICAEFLAKVGDVLGAERAEVIGWFAGRTDRIIQWPMSAAPKDGVKEHRMKLSRRDGDALRLRLEVDSRSAPSGDADGHSSRRVGESGTFRFNLNPADAASSDNGGSMRFSVSSSSSAGSGGGSASRISSRGSAPAGGMRMSTRSDGLGSTRRLVQTVSMAPWPALGERLRIPRSAVLEGLREGRARYWESREERNRPGDEYRETGAALTPPPIGAVEEQTGKRYVFMSLEDASKLNPLTWIVTPSWRTVGTARNARAKQGTQCNPVWSDILRPDVPQAAFLADTLEATAVSMYDACAEHLTVTEKTDEKASCTIDGAAFEQFGAILDTQNKALRGRLGDEVAGIVQAFYAFSEPLASGGPELVWNMSGMKEGKPAERGLVDIHRKVQGAGREYFTVTRRHPANGKTVSAGTFARWDLPPFLASLWKKPAPGQDAPAPSTGNNAEGDELQRRRSRLRQRLDAMRERAEQAD